MDFIHTYSGSEVDEIPSSELEVIDSKERLPRNPHRFALFQLNTTSRRSSEKVRL